MKSKFVEWLNQLGKREEQQQQQAKAAVPRGNKDRSKYMPGSGKRHA